MVTGLRPRSASREGLFAFDAHQAHSARAQEFDGLKARAVLPVANARQGGTTSVYLQPRSIRGRATPLTLVASRASRGVTALVTIDRFGYENRCKMAQSP